jgi:putative ABC transport system permease protein
MPQELPLQVRFLDDEFNKYYEGEKNLAQTLSALTLVAVVIACLGLFGLATFAAERRTKEIGIRKVLGASVASIVGLLSKDFLKLVGIAIVIATPLAYWAAGKWLQDFAYRVELTWWVFALAGVVAVVIAFATVATQAWKAARQNPVNALRSE